MAANLGEGLADFSGKGGGKFFSEGFLYLGIKR
jgi:hypothetical protein